MNPLANSSSPQKPAEQQQSTPRTAGPSQAMCHRRLISWLSDHFYDNFEPQQSLYSLRLAERERRFAVVQRSRVSQKQQNSSGDSSSVALNLLDGETEEERKGIKSSPLRKEGTHLESRSSFEATLDSVSALSMSGSGPALPQNQQQLATNNTIVLPSLPENGKTNPLELSRSHTSESRQLRGKKLMNEVVDSQQQPQAQHQQDDDNVPLNMWCPSFKRRPYVMSYENESVEREFSHFSYQNHLSSPSFTSLGLLVWMGVIAALQPWGLEINFEKYPSDGGVGMTTIPFYLIMLVATWIPLVGAGLRKGPFKDRSFRASATEWGVTIWGIMAMLGGPWSRYRSRPFCQDRTTDLLLCVKYPGDLVLVQYAGFTIFAPRLWGTCMIIGSGILGTLLGQIHGLSYGYLSQSSRELEIVMEMVLYSSVIALLLYRFREFQRRQLFQSQITLAHKIDESRRKQSEVNAVMRFLLPQHLLPRILTNRSVVDHREACVLISDIAGFTSWCSLRTPQHLVNVLGEIITAFDLCAIEFGVTRIKTVGDGYWAACGIPPPPKSLNDTRQKVADGIGQQGKGSDSVSSEEGPEGNSSTSASISASPSSTTVSEQPSGREYGEGKPLSSVLNNNDRIVEFGLRIHKLLEVVCLKYDKPLMMKSGHQQRKEPKIHQRSSAFSSSSGNYTSNSSTATTPKKNTLLLRNSTATSIISRSDVGEDGEMKTEDRVSITGSNNELLQDILGIHEDEEIRVNSSDAVGREGDREHDEDHQWSPLSLRAGIHSGKVLGTLLSVGHWTYEIYGPVVNVAGALETVCAPGSCLISDRTFGRLSRDVSEMCTVTWGAEGQLRGRCNLTPSPSSSSRPASVASSNASDVSVISNSGLANIPTEQRQGVFPTRALIPKSAHPSAFGEGVRGVDVETSSAYSGLTMATRAFPHDVDDEDVELMSHYNLEDLELESHGGPINTGSPRAVDRKQPELREFLAEVASKKEVTVVQLDAEDSDSQGGDYGEEEAKVLEAQIDTVLDTHQDLHLLQGKQQQQQLLAPHSREQQDAVNSSRRGKQGRPDSSNSTEDVGLNTPPPDSSNIQQQQQQHPDSNTSIILGLSSFQHFLEKEKYIQQLRVASMCLLVTFSALCMLILVQSGGVIKAVYSLIGDIRGENLYYKESFGVAWFTMTLLSVLNLMVPATPRFRPVERTFLLIICIAPLLIIHGNPDRPPIAGDSLGVTLILQTVVLFSPTRRLFWKGAFLYLTLVNVFSALLFPGGNRGFQDALSDAVLKLILNIAFLYMNRNSQLEVHQDYMINKKLEREIEECTSEAGVMKNVLALKIPQYMLSCVVDEFQRSGIVSNVCVNLDSVAVAFIRFDMPTCSSGEMGVGSSSMISCQSPAALTPRAAPRVHATSHQQEFGIPDYHRLEALIEALLRRQKRKPAGEVEGEGVERSACRYEQFLVSKVKTLGDITMLATELEPEYQPRRNDDAKEMCMALLRFLERLRNTLQESEPLPTPRVSRKQTQECQGPRNLLLPSDVEAGFALGPVVAAVVGRQQLEYDVFGTTVNRASRLLQHGSQGTQVQHSSPTPVQAPPQDEASGNTLGGSLPPPPSSYFSAPGTSFMMSGIAPSRYRCDEGFGRCIGLQLARETAENEVSPSTGSFKGPLGLKNKPPSQMGGILGEGGSSTNLYAALAELTGEEYEDFVLSRLVPHKMAQHAADLKGLGRVLIHEFIMK